MAIPRALNVPGCELGSLVNRLEKSSTHGKPGLNSVGKLGTPIFVLSFKASISCPDVCPDGVISEDMLLNIKKGDSRGENV